MTELLTRDEIIDALLAAIDAHPDQLNPMSTAGFCRYTSETDPNHHCLVGQVAADMGWDVPGPYDISSACGAATTYSWPLSRSAAWAAREAQARADDATRAGQSWSTIRANIEGLR